MPTIFRQSPTTALARPRAWVERLRRSALVGRPAFRWGLALAAAVGLVAAGYWTVISFSTNGVRYLASQRRFSADDLTKVCRALEKGRITYRVDEQRRVEVAADQFDQADALVANLDLGQRSIDEIRSESSATNIWETPGEREQKKELSREKILERLIGQLDGVRWSLVSIHRPRSPAWSRATAKPSAFVYIETEGNRKLPHQTVQSIPGILAGYEPELVAGAIRVMDQRGNKYLDPADPMLGEGSRNRAREEQLSEEIIEKLGWIKGVRVQVQVQVTGQPIVPAATARAGGGAAANEPGAPKAGVGGRPAGAASQADSAGSRPTMRVNQPLELAASSKLATEPPSPSRPASAQENASPLSAASAGPAGARSLESGRVLVYVPRSYYFNMHISTNDREPSGEDLRVMTVRTEKQVRTAVGLVIPESGTWRVDVDTFPDDVSQFRPIAGPSPSDPRRPLPMWGIVGSLAATVSILTAVGSWILLARRPARLPEPAVEGRRYHVGSKAEHGPSERVRELIRSNPEAAASVLQRWAGQEGGVA
jgi:hypothetical protein